MFLQKMFIKKIWIFTIIISDTQLTGVLINTAERSLLRVYLKIAEPCSGILHTNLFKSHSVQQAIEINDLCHSNNK